MEYSFLDYAAVLEVLYHDPLEEVRCHAGVPDTFGIHHHDGSSLANAKAGSLATLYPIRSEQQPFALQQGGEQRV